MPEPIKPVAGRDNAPSVDVARLYYADGRVIQFADQQLAYAAWLTLPKGVRAAFRGAGDTRPVYPWDYVDVG